METCTVRQFVENHLATVGQSEQALEELRRVFTKELQLVFDVPEDNKFMTSLPGAKVKRYRDLIIFFLNEEDRKLFQRLVPSHSEELFQSFKEAVQRNMEKKQKAETFLLKGKVIDVEALELGKSMILKTGETITRTGASSIKILSKGTTKVKFLPGAKEFNFDIQAGCSRMEISGAKFNSDAQFVNVCI